LMAAAPGPMARRLRKREEHSWVGAGGIRVRRAASDEPGREAGVKP
jgi:hypothetical protein